MANKDGNETVMVGIGTMVTGISVFVLAIFLAPLLGTLSGWYAAWVLSFFPIRESVEAFFHAIHIDLPLTQIGAGLGFVGGFFRSHLKLPKAQS